MPSLAPIPATAFDTHPTATRRGLRMEGPTPPKTPLWGWSSALAAAVAVVTGAASKLPVEIDRMNLVSFSTRRVRMVRTGIDNA